MDTINNYSDIEFQVHFHMERKTALHLIALYESSDVVPVSSNGGRSRIGASKEVYIFLWYLSNKENYRQMAHLFGKANSAIFNVLQRVCKWLSVIMAKEIICWPSDGTIETEMTTKFEQIFGIPSVIGAIDSWHIKIKGLKGNKMEYLNRHQYNSIYLQGIVDADQKFIDVFCGAPGSLNKWDVFGGSNICQRLQQTTSSNVLIATAAYPPSDIIIPPYQINGQMTNLEEHFNLLLLPYRLLVKNAFTILTKRFPRLLQLSDQTNVGCVVNYVMAACVLHNLCILLGDCTAIDIIGGDVIDDVDDDYMPILTHRIEAAAEQRRTRLMGEMIEKGLL